MATKRITMTQIVALTSAVALAGATPAWADHEEHYYDYAKVVDVTPLVTRTVVTIPHEQCRVETVRERVHYQHDRHGHGRRHVGPVPGLIGGLIGGVIGNQFGGGTGRKLLTVGGALIGASIATESAREHAARRHGHEHDYYRPAEREVCWTTEEQQEVERIDGYEVTYRYKGRQFVKRTDTRPGERIRIRVDVAPVLVMSDRAPRGDALERFRFRSSRLT